MTSPVSITWWGHATTTIQMAGKRILTDPVLTRRIAHLSRIGGPLPDADVLRADAAVISHLHMDHLNLPSLRMLGATVRIVAPIGAAALLRSRDPELGARVEEVRLDDVVELGGVSVRAVAAAHDGRRFPLSRHHGPALGFVFTADDGDLSQTTWFAGDTGLFAEMTDIGPVDVAVVPAGGWGPTLDATHLDPRQAAEAVRRVGARDAVPVHYGTFWPFGMRVAHPSSFRRSFADPGANFADELAIACPTARAHVLGHGETVSIPGRRRA